MFNVSTDKGDRMDTVSEALKGLGYMINERDERIDELETCLQVCDKSRAALGDRLEAAGRTIENLSRLNSEHNVRREALEKRLENISQIALTLLVAFNEGRKIVDSFSLDMTEVDIVEKKMQMNQESVKIIDECAQIIPGLQYMMGDVDKMKRNLKTTELHVSLMKMV